MYPNFVDNFVHPISLPAGQAQVELHLPVPDGIYLMTVADSITGATSHELVQAVVMGGEALIMRPGESLQEWPEGSVIYCGVNALVLDMIFSELKAFGEMLGGGPSYKGTLGLSVQYGSKLDGDRGQISGRVFDGVARIDVDENMPDMTVVEHVIIAEIWPSGTLRLHGNGRPVVEARLQNHPKLTFTMGADGEYIDINASSFCRCYIRLQTEIRLYDAPACAFIATFHDLDDEFSVLTSPPPNIS